eukprot:COSAG02_NODE_1266_length_13539_cov_216.818824_7_plen_281_part_00
MRDATDSHCLLPAIVAPTFNICIANCMSSGRCGLLWPDGTPVSYTEAAAIRHYLTGVSDFLLLDTFLPPGKAALTLTDDVTLNLTHGVVGYYSSFDSNSSNSITGPTNLSPKRDLDDAGVMLETSLWLGDAQHAAVIFVGDASDSDANSSCGWEVRLSHSALEVLRVSANSEKRVVGTVLSSALASGLPVGAWNLLRLELLRAPFAATSREKLSVFLNPTAHATSPTLGKVTPRLVVAEETSSQRDGRREVIIAPPAAGQGYFMVDYVSVLPGGGVARGK